MSLLRTQQLCIHILVGINSRFNNEFLFRRRKYQFPNGWRQAIRASTTSLGKIPVWPTFNRNRFIPAHVFVPEFPGHVQAQPSEEVRWGFAQRQIASWIPLRARENRRWFWQRSATSARQIHAAARVNVQEAGAIEEPIHTVAWWTLSAF